MAAMIFMSACAMVASETPLSACPPVVEYSTSDQTRAAIELEALPDGAMVVVRMLSDYAVLRDQARLCR